MVPTGNLLQFAAGGVAAVDATRDQRGGSSSNAPAAHSL